ncbi:MAG TPA: PQQ-dependent sugar dehydrogenase [Acidimicrobiales bacterium]|nr:PQQ-dependent sugar dehydrogenase [Acidimicrobiales bacterium]
MALVLVAAGCGGGDDEGGAPPSSSATTADQGPSTTGPSTTVTAADAPTTTRPEAAPDPAVATFESAGTRLAVTEVATGLDTVWSLAWDPEGRLWFTERGGRLTRLGEQPRTVAGVAESGEAGLMGLEIDGRGRVFVMYTGGSDNRVVEIRPDGSQRVLVSGIAKAAIHDGGRIRFGPDGALYASTGDAGDTDLSQQRDSLNGKVLRIDPDSGGHRVYSLGHRNIQGLCVAPGGRFLATEHGPAQGDEVNQITDGFNGGWPDRVGNGLRNYTPTIAPCGCAVYGADLIGAWKGSMLFVTLKDADLHRLTFGPDGSVTGDEVLLDGRFGRLRDVAVGPDGAVYLATSNRDGRGSPRPGDDRILRIAPA